MTDMTFRTVSTAFCAALAAAFLFTSCGKEPAKRSGESGQEPGQEQRDPNKIYIGVGHCGIGQELRDTFKKCIEDAGGEMVWFEYYAKYDGQAENLINSVDALIVPGSSADDTTGRTACDKKLISEAGSQGKPVLGICFGCQKINQSRKGSVPAVEEQQCWKEYSPQINHYKGSKFYSHSIKIDKDSKLYRIYGTDSLFVNSSHNYCVVNIGEGLKITAYAPDGIVEAIETIDGDPMNATANYVGVQFHPERLYVALNDSIHLKIFKYLVDEARKAKNAK